MKKRYWIAGAATAAIAGKLLLRPRDADWDKCRDVVFHSEHSCFVDVDGIRVHYQVAGDPKAPAIVLIHGFASSTLVCVAYAVVTRFLLTRTQQWRNTTLA